MKEIIVFWVSMVFVAFIMFLLTGCATKTVYVDRIVKVNVPVPCVTPVINKAVAGVNDADSLLGIIKERDLLRESVKSCNGH